MVRELVVRKLATSYGDHADTKTLYATYEGDDEAIIEALIATFDKYSVHSITRIFNKKGTQTPSLNPS